jgi:hypothetical protein
MLIIGNSQYGKTDHLPGLFFVVTEFLHFNHLPIIPHASYCLLDAGGSKQGVKIPLSGKSMLLGYLRGFLCVVCALFTFIGACILILDFKKLQFWEIAASGGLLLAGWVCFALTYLWQKPSPLRALELAKYLGVPLSTLAEHYVDDPRIEELVAKMQLESLAKEPNNAKS